MGGQEIEGEKKCTALTTRVTQLCNLVDSQYIYFIYIYIYIYKIKNKNPIDYILNLKCTAMRHKSGKRNLSY